MKYKKQELVDRELSTEKHDRSVTFTWSAEELREQKLKKGSLLAQLRVQPRVGDALSRHIPVSKSTKLTAQQKQTLSDLLELLLAEGLELEGFVPSEDDDEDDAV